MRPRGVREVITMRYSAKIVKARVVGTIVNEALVGLLEPADNDIMPNMPYTVIARSGVCGGGVSKAMV